MKNGCRLIKFPRLIDSRGSLSFFQKGDNIPFDIKRTSIINNSSILKKNGITFKNQDELILVLKGSIYIKVIYENLEQNILLNKPNEGLYIPKMTWRNIYKMDENTVTLVVGSGFNDEKILYKEAIVFNE